LIKCGVLFAMLLRLVWIQRYTPVISIAGTIVIIV